MLVAILSTVLSDREDGPHPDYISFFVFSVVITSARQLEMAAEQASDSEYTTVFVHVHDTDDSDQYYSHGGPPDSNEEVRSGSAATFALSTASNVEDRQDVSSSPDADDEETVGDDTDFDPEQLADDGECGSMVNHGDRTMRLNFWQSEIRKNVRGSYYTVGEALYRVLHQERLLKTSEFLKWAQSCFGLTRSTAYEYIRAYRIVKLLQARDPSLPVPSTLSHFRVFNKTKLKDGGVDVARLWRTILSELPPDSQQKPRTAKEVLSKGKEIMEREKIGEHAPRTNGLLPGSNRRQRPYEATPWQHEPGPKRSQQMSGGATCSQSPLHQRISAFTVRPKATLAAGLSVAGGDPAISSSGPFATEQSHWQGNASSFHSQARQQNGPFTRRSSQHQTSEPFDDSGEPPALIHIDSASTSPMSKPEARAESENVITVPQIYEAARGVIRNGVFDVSLTAPQCEEEKIALSQGGRPCRVLHTHRSRDQWCGSVWGNFTGPHAEEEIDLANCIDKAVEKFDTGEFDQATFLTGIGFGRGWFQKLIQYPHCFLNDDVEILARHTGSGKAGRGESHQVVRVNCAVFYLGPDIQRFVEQFRSLGTIPGVNTWCNYSYTADVRG